MNKSSDLRGAERCRAVFFRFQAVIAVIAEAAGCKALQPGRTDPDSSAVQGLYRSRAEVRAPQLGIVQELLRALRIIGLKPCRSRFRLRSGAGPVRRDGKRQRALP